MRLQVHKAHGMNSDQLESVSAAIGNVLLNPESNFRGSKEKTIYRMNSQYPKHNLYF